MSNTLTGIRDLDREIVNKLSDMDLLNMCSLNKTYWERVLNDDYFRLRTENGFPETVHYKDYVNKNEGKRKERKGRVRTWKNHYLTIVKYIDLLQTEYEYIYKNLDKSPELLYLARRLVSNYIAYSKEEALIVASKDGNLPVVKYLVENGADITYSENDAVIYASEKGHLPVVKYLVENGADITAQDNHALREASGSGRLPVVKYLVEHGADITDKNNEALRWASKNGHLPVVEYLRSLQK